MCVHARLCACVLHVQQLLRLRQVPQQSATHLRLPPLRQPPFPTTRK
jgi:hypothetical protein